MGIARVGRGRLSSIGIGRVGLVTTTGAKSGSPRTHPLTLINNSDTATDFYAGYERYRASCAPREIRVFHLRPTP